jgi:hypothetical protein
MIDWYLKIIETKVPGLDPLLGNRVAGKLQKLLLDFGMTTLQFQDKNLSMLSSAVTIASQSLK